MTFAWKTLRLAVLLSVAAAPAAHAAEAPPQGSYQAELLGRVDVSTDRERLVAVATEGGPCHFPRGQRVLEGELQGHVLMGQLTLCLEGPDCPATQTLAVLAIYTPEDKSLTAYVRPPDKCKAPGVGSGGLMVLQPATETAPRPLPEPARPRPDKRNPTVARAALKRGNELMGKKEWKSAIDEFQASVDNDPTWPAYYSLGTAWLMGNEPVKALDALQQARHLKGDSPGLHYYLACAYAGLNDKEQALQSMERAVNNGLKLPDGGWDRKLDALLATDPGTFSRYQQLKQTVVSNFDTKGPAGKRPPPGP